MPNIMSESGITKLLSPYSISDQIGTGDKGVNSSSFPTTLYFASGTTTPFHVWDVALRIYSAGLLTLASDKLVAISGIARELAPRIGGRYLAGLWEVQMARQLLWIAAPVPKAKDGSPARARCQPYRAPSWSWAATDQPLKMAMQWDYRGARNKRDFLIDILNADVVPAKGNDAFGQTSSAEITIRGRTIEIYLMSGPGNRNPEGSGQGAGRYRLVLDGQVLNEVTVFEDTEIDNDRERKFCVPISVSISTPEVSLDRRTLVYGLLLEKYEGGDKYRRIGVFMAPNGEDFLIDGKMDMNEKRSAVDTFDWRNCAQWHGDGGRTFGDDILVLV